MKQENISISQFVIDLGAHEARFNFPTTFFPFQGHFPGNPILPGFMSMATMEWAVPRMLNRNLKLACIKKSKFTGMVHPDQELCLTIVSVKEREGGVEVSVNAKVDEVLVAKAQLSFECIELLPCR